VITGADAAAIHRLGRQFDDSRILARLEGARSARVTVPDTVLDACAALPNAVTLVLAQLDDAVCNLAPQPPRYRGRVAQLVPAPPSSGWRS
jgi:hypothetical protein